ncbi:MAG: peptidoglycan DD-metalloendopeptidase family protein [Chitinophagaceae bacterium]|nr:peptidoglycan DD-metalloendopeptidase family protein [Chitinophagaceae bacterium]
MDMLKNILLKHQNEFHRVLVFDPLTDKLMRIDLSRSFNGLSASELGDTQKFSEYINSLLQSTGSKYGIGGYAEDRDLYKRSKLFSGETPRSIHLGIDIWGPAGTKVYAPLGGMIHSFAFNQGFGNYGATLILQHQLETRVFHTLYGHLSLPDIAGLQEGKYINRGELIGHFGTGAENGDWPPHLHLQVIEDLRLREGDYPGVCASSEKEFYLNNCPDPDLILNLLAYAR